MIYSTKCLYAIKTEAAFCIRSTNHSKLQDKSELTLKVYFGKANEISIIRSGNAEKLYCNTKTFYTALTSCHKNPLEIQGRQKIIALARTQIWLVRKKVTGNNAKWFFPLMSIQKMTPDTFTVRIDCWIDLFATILCQPAKVQHSLLWNSIESIFCMISIDIIKALVMRVCIFIHLSII